MHLNRIQGAIVEWHHLNYDIYIVIDSILQSQFMYLQQKKKHLSRRVGLNIRGIYDEPLK